MLNRTIQEDVFLEALEALEQLGRQEQPMAARPPTPIGYREWRVDLPHGSVRLWDSGNCWMNLTEVDLPPEDTQAFAENLQRLMDHPELAEQRELILVCTTGVR